MVDDTVDPPRGPPRKRQTVRISDEDARDLARVNAAALVRTLELDAFYGEDTMDRYRDSPVAIKKLEAARQRIARHIEDVV